MSDDLAIVAGDQQLTGWEDVEVTLRADAFPNSFAISTSAQGSVSQVAIAGARCAVVIGGDLVISGWIDRDVPSEDERGHRIALLGRGATCDLVDCSAEWPSGQMINGDALSISAKLAEPYGVPVRLGPGASAGPQLLSWLLNYGETPAEIIQRVARNAGLLAYEGSDGALVLGTAGTVQAASGVSRGVNVQNWSVENSVDQRYSDYVCALMGSDTAIDLKGAGDIFYHREADPNVKRHRQLDFVLETVASDTTPGDFTIKRARWEAARRAGRSTMVRATVDSWRDSAGTLWTPNTLVPVDLPGNRGGDQMILGSVTFRRSDESGTTAELELMPPAAFAVEPIALQPVPADLTGPGQ